MTEIVAKHLRVPEERVLVASTGVIGAICRWTRSVPALPKLVKALSPQGGRAAAEGIMTTDTHPKEAALRVEIGGRRVTVGGIAKGTGMIHPMMATMFCFVATDLGGARGASGPSAGGHRLVQPHQRRRGPQHQRHGGDPGQRVGREPPAHPGRPAAASVPAGPRRVDPAPGGDAGEGRRGGDGGRRRAGARGQARRDAELAARSIGNSRSSRPPWPAATELGSVMSALGASRHRPQEDRVAIWYGEEQVAAGAGSGKAFAGTASRPSWPSRRSPSPSTSASGPPRTTSGPAT